MIPGQNYEVRYKLQSGNYRWYEYVAIMTYVTWDAGNYVFSLRPLAGTQTLPRECYLWSKQTDKPVRAPRKLGALHDSQDPQ